MTTVTDAANTVRGQLSYCTYLLNQFTEHAETVDDDQLIELIIDIDHQLNVARQNVNLMLDAYEQPRRRPAASVR